MQITLLTGAKIESQELTFDRNTYHFFFRGVDITDDIRRADKISIVPNFDVTKDNYRLSDEGPVTGQKGNYGLNDLDESTTRILVKQLATDPLGAPIESLNRTAEKFFALPGIQKILIVGAIGAVLYIAVKKA